MAEEDFEKKLNVKDENLFLVWKKSTQQVKENNLENKSLKNNTDFEDILSSADPSIEDPSQSTPVDINIFTTSVKVDDEQPVNTDPLIPPAFKSAMFWPNPKPSVKKGRSKEKVPAVTSSEEYRTYIKKRQDKKEEEERLKEERKQARLAKAAEREKKMTAKPPPKKRAKKQK